MADMAKTTVVDNEEKLISELATFIEKHANKAISERKTFQVGVSGGSLVKFLVQGLPKITTDFGKWTFFFCDERVVPERDNESTFGAYKAGLIGKLPALTESQFVKIKQGLSASEAALEYTQQIFSHFPSTPEGALPAFDMLLLGMGPDGHTCSLFPGHALLEEKDLWIAPITDSPKPPPERITMTLPLINAARCCVFPISGQGKAEMVKRIFKSEEDLPVKRVQPTNGELYFILDKGAAELIHKY